MFYANVTTPLATGMAAAAAVTMVVAGSSSSTGASPSSGIGASGKNIELVVGTKSDDFYVTMECGAKAEAQALGVNLTVTGPAVFGASEQAPILTPWRSASSTRSSSRRLTPPRSTPSCRGSPARA
jgi:ribose transport system substrate-binding protein